MIVIVMHHDQVHTRRFVADAIIACVRGRYIGNGLGEHVLAARFVIGRGHGQPGTRVWGVEG